MVPRKILLVLVVALPVLVTTFAVLMAGHLLATGLNDADGAAVLRGFALACLVSLGVVVVLLVGLLGVNSLEAVRRDDRHESDRET